MRHFRTTAFVIHKQKLGDYDYFVRLLTREKGLISGIIKGARKIDSRHQGHFELFNLNNLQIYHSPKNNIITESQILDSFGEIKKPFRGAKILFNISEIIIRSIPEEQPLSDSLFNLLHSHLKAIVAVPQKAGLILESFKIKLLQINGLLGALEYCSGCHQNLATSQPQKFGFDFQANSLRCINCLSDEIKELSVHQTKLLRILSRQSLKIVLKLQISETDIQIICEISTLILENHIQKKLLSAQLLA